MEAKHSFLVPVFSSFSAKKHLLAFFVFSLHEDGGYYIPLAFYLQIVVVLDTRSFISISYGSDGGREGRFFSFSHT